VTARPTVRAALGRLFRLARKELSESLRDRRTITTLVLMPVLLYPVLAIAFQQMLLSSKIDSARMRYRVGFVSAQEEKELLNYWNEGLKGLDRRHRTASGKEGDTSELLTPIPELLTSTPDDLEGAVRAGEIDVGVRLRPPGALSPTRFPHVQCEMLYRTRSAHGREAVRYLEWLTTEMNAQVLKGRLQALGPLATQVNALRVRQGLRPLRVIVPPRADPVRVHTEALPDETAKRSEMMPILVPLILILMTMTGAVYPAIDLTAGERERGTLEVLVAAPIPRMSVLLAKYVAVLTVAMLTALVNLGMMAGTLRATGIGKEVFGDALGPLALVQVFLLLLLFAGFFSAVLLALTSFARSFKEAQAYLIPLMLFCMLPGMMALWPGLSLEGPLAIVPLLNIVLLSRDLLGGGASPAAAVVVVISTLVYALAAVALAARIFGTEAVLSSTPAGWADLFRRPARPRAEVGVPAALLCLALMFPIYFVLTSGVGQMEELSLRDRMGLTAAGSVLLFAVLPLVFLWFGRVRLGTSLRLGAPGVGACIVAGLLGLSLWPWAHELVLLLDRLGLATLGQEYRERTTEVMKQWREISPVYLVLVLAVVPAVLEELFFRGFLFSALAGEEGRAGLAIAGSSALFALFHVLVPGGLAVEKFVLSLALGLVLGWLAYTSGSVVPGMLLHVLHNGVLVLIGYYEPRLVEAGWVAKGQEHAPAWLLGATGAMALLGLAGLVWMTRMRASEPEDTEQANT
jgi:ABC-2 type transport system permease protein/sodium transport system permease protein